MSTALYSPIYHVFAAIKIPIDIIVVTIDNISTTFINSITSLKTLSIDDAGLSENISAASVHTERKKRHITICNIDGKNTRATATIPTTPTLLFISDE